MKQNDGFTIVELLAVMAILGVLSLIAIGATTKFFSQSEEKVYQEFESTMEVATENYLLEHSDQIPNQNESRKITLETLIDEQYSEILEDPEEQSGQCSGYVKVTNQGDIGLNLNLTYQACLRCSRYESASCER